MIYLLHLAYCRNVVISLFRNYIKYYDVSHYCDKKNTMPYSSNSDETLLRRNRKVIWRSWVCILMMPQPSTAGSSREQTWPVPSGQEGHQILSLSCQSQWIVANHRRVWAHAHVGECIWVASCALEEAASPFLVGSCHAIGESCLVGGYDQIR